MFFVYLLSNIGMLIIAKRICRRFINPVSIVNLAWLGMISLYEMKLIAYYPIKPYTYFITILIMFVFNGFTLLGVVSKKRYKFVVTDLKQTVSKTKYIKEYKRLLIIVTCIGGLSIIYSFIQIVMHYGSGFVRGIATIYSDRVTGGFSIKNIDYVGSFIYISTIMTGLYFGKYGFDKVLLFPLALVIMSPFISGTKEVITECIILLMGSYYSAWLSKQSDLTKIFKRKHKKKKILLVVAICIIVVFVFGFVTNQRGAYVKGASGLQDLMTPLFRNVVSVFPGAYTLYTYIASPFGVLNAYLEKPDYHFGGNTLLPLYRFLDKFGIKIEYNNYQSFYLIPISINVGTVIREIIQDYTLVGAIVFFALAGLLFGMLYRNMLKKKTLQSKFLFSFAVMISIMSFFVWSLRSTGQIIAIIFGAIITGYLDRYCIAGNMEYLPAAFE